MSISSYNKSVPLGSAYSDALTRPLAADSFLIRNQNVSFQPTTPREVSNKNFFIGSNSTVNIPNSTTGNVYINCGNFNTIRNEINNLNTGFNINGNANVIQRYFFTPTDKSKEFEYISKHLSPNETLIDTIPIKSQKFRMELINENLSSNASVYLNNTLLYYSQYNTHSHNHEVINNPVNLNVRNNNNFYDDATRNQIKNLDYKNICGYIDSVNGSNKQAFWNIDRRYFSSTSSFRPTIASNNSLDADLKIKVEGLDINGNELQEIINLNSTDGTIPVQTSNAFLRINNATADLIQDVGTFDYGLNQGNVSLYVASTGITNGTQELIAENRTASNTIKYAVPKGKEILIKDINLNGVVGFYEPQLDIFVNKNIIQSTGGNIFKKVFTTRLQDNQNVSQHFTDLNIKVDELQEFYMEFNPNGASSQETFITLSLNYVEYPKKDYY